MPQTPQVVPTPQTVPVAQVTPQQPDAQSSIGELLRQDGYSSTKAQSSQDGEVCPDCSSQNYLAPPGQPNAMKQCFNCGFNPRFQHSTHGASGIGQKNLPVHSARAQTLSENNFNPGVIVGHA
jgi:Zn ribbon nucleic-acid-binding protein